MNIVNDVNNCYLFPLKEIFKIFIIYKTPLNEQDPELLKVNNFRDFMKHKIHESAITA